MASSADTGGELAARFLDAQNRVYPEVLTELRTGQKRTHWMWFIFPQVAGLGHSEMAQRYALNGLEEAQHYVRHSVLRARLIECTAAVLLHAPGSAAPRSLAQLFGSPDDRKFHSSMTLFRRAAPEEELFASALEAFWNGAEDSETIKHL